MEPERGQNILVQNMLVFAENLMVCILTLTHTSTTTHLCSRMVMSQGENMGLEREMIVTVKKGMWSDELWFL